MLLLQQIRDPKADLSRKSADNNYRHVLNNLELEALWVAVPEIGR